MSNTLSEAVVMHAALKIGAVTLLVADVARSAAFYRQVIGLQVHTTAMDETVLGTGQRNLVVLRHLPNGRFVRRATGLYHLALRVPGRADLSRWLRHYAEHNAAYWQGASDHGVSEALYLTDPEGNGIEIYCDTPCLTWSFLPDGQIKLVARPLDLQTLMAETTGPPSTQLPDETDMGHVHLKVHDLAAAEYFYRHVLNFAVKSRYQDSALFIAGGDYHHHIGLNTWHSHGAAPKPADAYGLAEATLELPHREALEELRVRLAAAKYPHVCAVTDECLLTDPSGIPLRITTRESKYVRA